MIFYQILVSIVIIGSVLYDFMSAVYVGITSLYALFPIGLLYVAITIEHFTHYVQSKRLNLMVLYSLYMYRIMGNILLYYFFELNPYYMISVIMK